MNKLARWPFSFTRKSMCRECHYLLAHWQSLPYDRECACGFGKPMTAAERAAHEQAYRDRLAIAMCCRL